MSGLLPYLGALALFLIGVRLTAFFSGIETGFYRASRLRLGIDAQGGDPLAKRIRWFSQNASHFVVTTLVGNNIANYLLTAAVGLAAARAGLEEGMVVEIFSTLLIAPIVFPKRMGTSAEFAQLVRSLIDNDYMNAEVIRFDGGIRFQPK